MNTRRRRRPRMRRTSRLAPRSMQYMERFLLDGAVELAHIRSWADVTVSVQLPPTWLAAGRLPSLAPGDVRDLVPTVYMAEYSPVADLDEYYSDCDPKGDWWCSEAGTLTARGGLIPPVPGNAGLQTFLLDIAGRTFPLN